MISTTAALIGMGIMAGGSVGAAAIGSRAAGKAAETQASAADRAAQSQIEAARYQADLQYKAAQEANALQKEIYDQNRADLEPWRQAGTSGLAELLRQMGLGGESAVNSGGQVNRARGDRAGGSGAGADSVPSGFLGKTFDLTFDGDAYKFDSSRVDVTKDPGYQFRLSEGIKTIERGAAARGGSLGGATAKALARYSQDYASNEYGNAYARAFQANSDEYNRALGEYRTKFDVFSTNQANQYNRLAGLAGIGQQATNTIASAGQNYAGQVGQNNTNAANTAGQIIINGTNNAAQSSMAGANARASGYVGSANAWGGALGNLGSSALNLYMLSQLGKSGTPGVDLSTLKNLGIALP